MSIEGLNECWKTVVDSIQDGVMVVVNPSSTDISVKKGFESITGCTNKEIIRNHARFLIAAPARTRVKMEVAIGA
jgi:hypothetical protein